MKFEMLKNMTLSELYQKIADLKKEAFNIRVLAASSQATNPNQLKMLRRDVARIKTRIQQLKNSA